MSTAKGVHLPEGFHTYIARKIFKNKSARNSFAIINYRLKQPENRGGWKKSTINHLVSRYKIEKLNRII